MSAAHRIADANANRAREALRVMEDAARFALDNAELSQVLKTLRHDLRAALEQPPFDRGLLLASRDSTHDVGLGIKTPAELSRASLRDAAAAAAARLTEALRSLEEVAKTLTADPRPIELLRYRAYEAEKRLLLSLPTGRARQWRLCVLITESLCTGGHSWIDVARAAVDAGADCIQLREKSLSDRDLLLRSEQLLRVLDARADLIINDRPDIALLCGARGVHLGQSDLPIDRVRQLAGFRLLIGVSTSNIVQARAAVGSGADYCGVGPMFPTTTKHKETISGPQYLLEYLADPLTRDCPHLAIGGVTVDRTGELASVGCLGIAASSAVCQSSDPGAETRKLLERLGIHKALLC